MNFLNSILYNKPGKFFYYLRSFTGYCLPKFIWQRKLNATLARVESRLDKDYILDRVNYYNQLGATVVPVQFKKIGDHKYRRNLKSVYFFDTYEFTRWFKDTYRWHYLEGDITTVPEVPSIVKSRPVAGSNANSVILNLDKIRHFVFFKR